MSTVIIPGMYRSGTTALVRALERVGFIPGNWADQYREPAEITGWNRCEKNTNPPSHATCPFTYKASDEFEVRLQLWRDQYAELNTVIKDPQIAPFLAAYAEVWPDAKYVLCLRNPLSAIWSQRKRGNIGDEFTDVDSLGAHCQMVSNVMAVANIRGLDLHLFNYDGDIEAEQTALSAFLGTDIDLAAGWEWGQQSR